MSNFITEFMRVTALVESPNSYLEWAAYSAISAVLRHNIIYDFPSRRTKVAPNLYVLIVGDSGATRKSTPLKLVNFLVKQVGNTKLMEGRASIQGILKELGAVKRTDKQTIKYAAGLLYAEEFDAFLVKDPSTSGILTDIYDYKETHETLLKSEDTLRLEKVCVSLLAATNVVFLRSMFSNSDVYGGLVGRTILIIESKPRLRTLGLNDPTTDADWYKLIDHLTRISKLEGKVYISKDTEDYMEKWYKSIDPSFNESKTGFEHRLHSHALKLGLILAAAEWDFGKDGKLEVTKEHFQQAIDIVMKLRINYHYIANSVGHAVKSPAEAASLIITELFKHPKESVSKEDLLRLLMGQVDVTQFDSAIITLQQANYVEYSECNPPKFRITQAAYEKVSGGLMKKEKVN